MEKNNGYINVTNVFDMITLQTPNIHIIFFGCYDIVGSKYIGLARCYDALITTFISLSFVDYNKTFSHVVKSTTIPCTCHNVKALLT